MAEIGEALVRVHADTVRMAEAFEATAIASYRFACTSRYFVLWWEISFADYFVLEAEEARAEREIAAAFDRWWSAGEMAEEIIAFIEDHAARSAEQSRAHRQIEAAYFAWSAGL